MLDAVIVEKGETIGRAAARAREEYAAAVEWEEDYSRQDAALINVQRACEAAIDIGNRLLLLKRLGPANENRQIYEKLERAKLIDRELARRLIGMVGFRNVAVHDYRKLDLIKARWVIEHGLDDLFAFANLALRSTTTPD